MPLFQQLCVDYCAAAKSTVPALTPTMSGDQGFETQIDGTPITVLRVQDSAADRVHVLMEFGLPARPDEASTWQALLDANFAMVSRFALCFSRDPQSGHVMLQFQAPLDAMSGDDLFQNCKQLAELAAGWRRGDLRISAPGPVASQPGSKASMTTAFA